MTRLRMVLGFVYSILRENCIIFVQRSSVSCASVGCLDCPGTATLPIPDAYSKEYLAVLRSDHMDHQRLIRKADIRLCEGAAGAYTAHHTVIAPYIAKLEHC